MLFVPRTARIGLQRQIDRVVECGELAWCLAGALSDAKGRFRKLRGHRDMKTLLAVLKARSTPVRDAERKAA